MPEVELPVSVVAHDEDDDWMEVAMEDGRIVELDATAVVMGKAVGIAVLNSDSAISELVVAVLAIEIAVGIFVLYSTSVVSELDGKVIATEEGAKVLVLDPSWVVANFDRVAAPDAEEAFPQSEIVTVVVIWTEDVVVPQPLAVRDISTHLSCPATGMV